MSEVTPSVTGLPRDGAHIILGWGSVSRRPQVPWEFSLSLPQPDLPGATGQDWEPAKAELTVDESGWRKPVTRTPLPSSDRDQQLVSNDWGSPDLRENCLLSV